MSQGLRFEFVPSPNPLTVSAFSRPFKVLATVLIGGCALWMWQLWRAGLLVAQTANGTFAGLAWPLAAWLLMAYTGWHLLRSQTTLNHECLQQTWLWNKRMDLHDLAYCKLIRVPGLDWLIAPRLYARTLLGKFAVFYAADAAMLHEFARLRDELKRFRAG